MAVSVYVRSLSLSNDKQRCFSKISVSKEEETTTWSIDRAYEPPFPERKHKVVGYCKGLFCLEFENGRVLLWNPSKKEFKFLPPSELKTPPCPSPNCPIMDCSVRMASGVRGLGFDPKSGDYKVVTLASIFYSHCKDCYSTKQVEVYSLKDNCWKEIGSEGDEYYILDDYATYLDGCCYWTAHTSAFSGYLIISLDLSSYEFSRVLIPWGGGGFCLADSGVILTDYDQSSLALIVHKWDNRVGKTYKMMSCWVRGPDEEWIQTMNNFKYRGAEKPLGFCGDVLMLEAIDGGLLIYDSHQKLLSKIDGIYDYALCMRISPFMKSKVHLAEGEKEKEEKSKWSLIPQKNRDPESEPEATKVPSKKSRKSRREGESEEQHHLMFHSGRKEFRIIRISSSLYEWSTEDVSPPFVEKKIPSFIAACKELFCLSYDHQAEYILWNSFTNEYKSIPLSKLELPGCVDHEYDSSSTCTRSLSSNLFGLGFDSESNDYKLVKFTTVTYYDDEACIYMHSVRRQISVYSLNKNSWKEIPDPEFYDISGLYSVSSNGICYWGPSEPTNLSNSKSVVVAFNFASEEFSTFPIPDIPLGSGSTSDLIDFNGSLAFVVSSSWYGVSKCFRFWILNVEDGVSVWVRKEKLDVSGVGAWHPLGSCRSGGSLLLQGMNGALFEYDYYTRNMKIMEEIADHPCCMHLVSFAESCVRLNANETGSKRKKKKIKEEKGKGKWLLTPHKRKGEKEGDDEGS